MQQINWQNHLIKLVSARRPYMVTKLRTPARQLWRVSEQEKRECWWLQILQHVELILMISLTLSITKCRMYRRPMFTVLAEQEGQERVELRYHSVTGVKKLFLPIFKS